jgi:hypothetical protein
MDKGDPRDVKEKGAANEEPVEEEDEENPPSLPK